MCVWERERKKERERERERGRGRDIYLAKSTKYIERDIKRLKFEDEVYGLVSELAVSLQVLSLCNPGLARIIKNPRIRIKP